MKQQLEEILQSSIAQIGITDVSVQLETPADLQFGDYTTNVAMIVAKKVGKKPREVALGLKDSMENGKWKMENISKIEVAGPGFVNFWVSKEKLVDSLGRRAESIRHRQGTGYSGQEVEKNKKNVVVEYSSPNIAKPFTIGHLRSTIIGDAVANLLEYCGWHVFRDNHVGDWGTQFGKQIYSIKVWGNEEAIEQSDRPVKTLVDLYVKFHEEAEKDPSLEDKAREWFKKLEDGDAEARKLWQKCIDWSWKEFDSIYQQLGVSFTENNGRGYGESYFEDKMRSVVQELREKGLLKTGKEGAEIVEFPESTKLPPLMIIKKDGASLYATRDLATDKFRLGHYGKDVTIINEVGAEQELYFRQLIALEQMLGWITLGQKVHIKHGLYRFKEGKMSTRKGNVIWLEDVLAEAKERAFLLANKPRDSDSSENSDNQSISESQKVRNSDDADNPVHKSPELSELSEKVAIGAIKWNDLKRDAKQDITFDWDDILSMEGNSGPYMQYAYARTQSVIAKSKIKNQNAKIQVNSQKFEKEEMELIRLLYKFDETVAAAAEEYSPNILCNYLYTVAQQFNVFYQKHSILKAESSVREVRLLLTDGTGKVIKQGLQLLGIDTPQQM